MLPVHGSRSDDPIVAAEIDEARADLGRFGISMVLDMRTAAPNAESGRFFKTIACLPCPAKNSQQVIRSSFSLREDFIEQICRSHCLGDVRHHTADAAEVLLIGKRRNSRDRRRRSILKEL